MAGRWLIGFCFTGKHRTACDLHLDGTEQTLLSQPRVGEHSPAIIEIFLFFHLRKKGGKRKMWKGRKREKARRGSSVEFIMHLK